MISNLNDIIVDIDRGVQHDVHVLGSIGLILESQCGNPYPATSQSFWYFASSQAPGRWWFMKEKKNRRSPSLPLLARQRRRGYWAVYSFVSVSARFHHDPGTFFQNNFLQVIPTDQVTFYLAYILTLYLAFRVLVLLLVVLLLLQFLLDHVCINCHLHFRLANSWPSSLPTSQLSVHRWTSWPDRMPEDMPESKL